jgi:hypothetical protein
MNVLDAIRNCQRTLSKLCCVLLAIAIALYILDVHAASQQVRAHAS